VDAGIDAALAANRRPLTVRRHYLRLDRIARPEPRAAAAAEARMAIDRFDPDLLLAVDDESNAAVASHSVARGRPRIIYVSIDQPPERYGYPGPDRGGNRVLVTGIREELPLAAIRDAVAAIRGDGGARIAAVGIDSDTGRAERMQVEAFDWSPHAVTAVATAGDLAAWQRFVTVEAADADVLLVLSSAGLARAAGSGETVGGAEVASWVEAHAKPLPIGVHAGFVADGGGLAISPAATDYGSRAMTMALVWLDAPAGPPPRSETSGHFDVALSPARLAARGVELPAIYAEAARAAGALVPRAVAGHSGGGPPGVRRPRSPRDP
ncbi:MAG: hypothetical protein ACKONH_00030, partial [Planctomycetia bacterium]